jgi:hypothetical protein
MNVVQYILCGVDRGGALNPRWANHLSMSKMEFKKRLFTLILDLLTFTHYINLDFLQTGK